MDVSHLQPLPDEIVHEPRGTWVGQHAPAPVALKTAGSLSWSRVAISSSSSSGMLFHRKKDSREASSRSLSRYTCPGCVSTDRRATCSRNRGIDSSASSARSIPWSKITGVPALPIDAKQRVDIGIRHWPPVRAPRQRGQDLLCARLRVARAGGPARENPLAARRVLWNRAVERPRDVHMYTMSMPGRSVATPGDGAELVKPHRHEPRARLDPYPDLQGMVGGSCGTRASAGPRYRLQGLRSSSRDRVQGNLPPIGNRLISARSTRSSISCSFSPTPSIVSTVPLRFRRIAKVYWPSRGKW